MTTKLEQAARQALEALEELHYSSGTVVAARKYESATSALLEALAEQSEQKPVLCVECGQPTMHMGNKCYSCCQKATRGLEDALKAAVPVRTKDLTDEEIVSLINSVWFLDELMVAKVNFARAVIAADREKNK